MPIDHDTIKAVLDLIFYRIEGADQNPFSPWDGPTLERIYGDVQRLTPERLYEYGDAN